jgi:hypothetical protein
MSLESQSVDNDDEPTWADVLLMIPRPHRSKVLNELCRRAHEVEQLAAEVARLTPPPPHHQRIRERDRAIREAIAEHYGTLKITRAAERMAHDLAVYAKGTYRLNEPVMSEQYRAFQAILDLNGGAAPSKTTIFNLIPKPRQ